MQILDRASVDIDGSGSYDALTDGLLLMRYLSGLSGNPLTNGATGAGATRTTPAQAWQFMENMRPLLDVDGDGQVEALTDGLMLIRYLFGLRDASLIDGAIGSNPTRATAPAIGAHIKSLMP